MSARHRPALLRALGNQEPPAAITVSGETFTLREVYKHDSWAATARYNGPTFDLVCKFNRIQPIFILPMSWLGRLLAKREAWFLDKLAGVKTTPDVYPEIMADGKILRHAVAHTYIEGEPLTLDRQLPDRFFVELRQLLEQVHELGIAYVDLHKRENILVTLDERPCLIDFQVSFAPGTRRWWNNPVTRFALRALQQADRYHLAKHVHRHAAHLVEQCGLTNDQRPWWITAHRFVAVPLRSLRRGLLVWMGVRTKGGMAQSETFPEHTIRIESEQKSARKQAA